MDSAGNSGSFQSSSGGGGGGEEFDSHTDMISAFINPSATTQQPSQPPPPQCHGKTSTVVFDHSLSNYFLPNMPRPSTQNLQNPCSSFMNLDMDWSKTIISDPHIPLLAPSSSSPQQPHFGSQNLQVPFTQVMESNSGGGGGSAGIGGSGGGAMITPPRRGSSSDHQAHNVVVVRPNPKKRSRASRRAPTTVLTTDTNNFRAMVQEFTGIPSPPPLAPFSSSSPFPRTNRFDLFGTSSATRSYNPSERQLPYHIHRPFPQKIRQPFPSSLPSSSMLSNSSLMVDELSLLKQPIQSTTNLFGMENPIFSSLLHSTTTTTPPKSPLENPEVLMGSKPSGSMQIAPDEPHLKRVFLDEFGLGHNHVNSNVSGLSCLVSSDQTPMKNDNNLANWGDGGGLNGGDQSPMMIRRST